MAKTEEQKKARVTQQKKYRDSKRESMGEAAYLAERAEYERERYRRKKTMGKPRVRSMKPDAMRKRIQRERAALKKREAELAAAVERRNVTDNTTAAAPTATSTAAVTVVPKPTRTTTMAKTEEQKKARVTAQQKYSDNKRKSMGEEAYLAERAKYDREYYRKNSKTEVGVKSMTYAAVRKRIQRERVSLKNKEKESVATITTKGTNKVTIATATSTAEAAAILTGISSVTVPKSTCTTNNKIMIKVLGKGDSESSSDHGTIPGGGVMATATNTPVVKTQEVVHNSTHTSMLAASVAKAAAAMMEASARTGTVLSPILP